MTSEGGGDALTPYEDAIQRLNEAAARHKVAAEDLRSAARELKIAGVYHTDDTGVDHVLQIVRISHTGLGLLVWTR